MESNRLGHRACVVLAAGIMGNKVVRRVVLDGNPVGKEGGGKLVECLVKAEIRELSLHGCNMGDDRLGSEEAVFDAKQPNKR